MITLTELTELIQAVQADICDEYRAYEYDDAPGIQLTIATDDDGNGFAFQTGDNSYSGACYHYPHWASCGVYLDTDPEECARDLLEELENTRREYVYWASIIANEERDHA